MKAIIKIRWVSIIVWAVLATVLTVFLPDLNAVIKNRGNATLDSSYPSQDAYKLIE